MRKTSFQSLLLYVSRIASLMRKETRALLKDPKSRAILVVPVVVQSLLFGYAASFELKYAPYALVDQCRCRASADLLARIDSTGIFVRTSTASTEPEAEYEILRERAALAIIIPNDFGKKLARGEAAPLQLLLDGRNSMTAGLSSAYLGQIAATYGADLLGRSAPVTVVTRAWFNENLDSRWAILVALVASLSLLQTLLLSAFSVAREREQGTFEQLLVSPLTPTQILVGKAVPPILVGLSQSTVILLVVRFWFGIPFPGSVALLYLGLLVFNISIVGIGLSISSVARSMQQAMLYAFLFLVPSFILSGLLSPVSNMAAALQYGTFANPVRFGIDFVRRVYLEGAGFADVWLDFVPLGIIAAISLPLAGWLFRHRLA